MAMWLIAVVGAAPCQCRSPGGNQTTSPGADGLHRPATGLDEPATGGDDQGLPERMRVPGRPRAGLEGHEAAARPRRRLGLEQRIDPDRPGEMFGRRLARRPGAASDHVHELVLLCSRNGRGGPDPPARTASAPRGAQELDAVDRDGRVQPAELRVVPGGRGRRRAPSSGCRTGASWPRRRRSRTASAGSGWRNRGSRPRRAAPGRAASSRAPPALRRCGREGHATVASQIWRKEAFPRTARASLGGGSTVAKAAFLALATDVEPRPALFSAAMILAVLAAATPPWCGAPGRRGDHADFSVSARRRSPRGRPHGLLPESSAPLKDASCCEYIWMIYNETWRDVHPGRDVGSAGHIGAAGQLPELRQRPARIRRRARIRLTEGRP